MKNDLRGVHVTGANTFALQHYETALEQFQTYVGDPIATIDEALKTAPAFIAGHMLKALVLYPSGAQVRADGAQALDVPGSTPPARTIGSVPISAAEFWLGRWQRSQNRSVLTTPARRAPLQVGHLMILSRRCTNLRTRLSRVLPHWEHRFRVLLRARHVPLASRR
jgi:hypothetical protein